MVKDIANKIVNALVADFTDRRGFRQEWDNCDEDIQNEIEETWNEIVLSHLSDLTALEQECERLREHKQQLIIECHERFALIQKLESQLTAAQKENDGLQFAVNQVGNQTEKIKQLRIDVAAEKEARDGLQIALDRMTEVANDATKKWKDAEERAEKAEARLKPIEEVYSVYRDVDKHLSNETKLKETFELGTLYHLWQAIKKSQE